jgi:hypothetical protein
MRLNDLHRRAAVAVGSVSVALFIGACGGEDTTGATAPPAGAAVPAPTASSAPAPQTSAAPTSVASAPTASKATSCRAATEAKVEFARTVASSPDGAASYKKAFEQMGARLGKIAGSASDPAAATVMRDVADELAALAATANPETADMSSFEKAAEKLDALCKGVQ